MLVAYYVSRGQQKVLPSLKKELLVVKYLIEC